MHSVLNEDVLDAMKAHCEVHSKMKYSNLWHEGKATTIWNGDRYLYVTLSDAQKLPQSIDVSMYKARVFKPLSVMKCKRCSAEGHHLSDDKCPAKAPVELQDTVEPFCSGKCVLSNLHKCLDGCKIEDLGTKFQMSEQHFQFKKLKFHGLGAEAYEMLMEEDGFKAMKRAKELLLEDKVEQDWKHRAKEEMTNSVQKKFRSCSHAHLKLLDVEMVIAEATGDDYWGTGLNVQQTLEIF